MDSINLSKVNAITMSLNVQNSSKTVTEARLVLSSNRSYSFVFYGTIEGTTVRFDLPVLETMIDGESASLKVEIVIDNAIFTPISETVSLERSIVVKAAKPVLAKPLEEKVTVSELTAVTLEPMLIERRGDMIYDNSKGEYVGFYSDDQPIYFDSSLGEGESAES